MSKKWTIPVILIFLVADGCLRNPGFTNEHNSRLGPGKGASPIEPCSLDGFYQSDVEHIINEIKEPFVVRKIKGRIRIVDGYEWPQSTRVLVEIRNRGKDQEVIRTLANNNGEFSFGHIRDGIYCFKITAEGWQSVMGIIIVSQEAGKKSRILIDMEFGV